MKYILYLHIWLSIIAMLLTMECILFFAPDKINYTIILFAGAATLFTYNAHTLFALYSKKNSTEVTSWGRKKYNYIFVAMLLGFVCSLSICVMYFNFNQWLIFIVSSGLWLVYEIYIVYANRRGLLLNNHSFFKSIVIAIVWTIITGVLPLSKSETDIVWSANAGLFIGVRFCLFAFITQLFEYRDFYIDKAIKKVSHLNGKTIGYSNITVICYLFFAAIVLQLFIVELHVSFKIATILQMVFLLFCLRIKNIITLTPSMLIWDGVLILSPLISIPALYL